MSRAAWPLVVLLLGACGGSGGGAAPRTVASFDLGANLEAPEHFFDYPYPSDLRLTPSGAPDVTGVPNPLKSGIVEGLRTIAMQRGGFPVMPVAYFRFSAALAPLEPATVIAADPLSPVLLVDLDAGATLVPTVAQTLAQDPYVPDNLLAVAPRPGFVLQPRHKHAVVVRRGLRDLAGNLLDRPAGLVAIQAGKGSAAEDALYAPLWLGLRSLGVSAEDVAAATVFTTGDVVADTADLSTRVAAQYKVTLTGLAIDPNGGATHDRFCELRGTVTYPQFQKGAAPYDTDGLFTLGADGLPVKQRDEVAPIALTLPKQPMPAGGYPLVVYFHGTGGRSTAFADRGPWHLETDQTKCPDGALDTWNGKTGCNTAGQGPGYVVAEHGIAMAASALPVNPERWPPGATRDLPEYFNINNLAAMRDTFRQGILEQRMFIEALSGASIDPAVVAACSGMSLPPGETAFHFKADPLLAQGQSMGAMYANLISAVEPRIKAVVASGAGGFWTYFILETSFISNLQGKIGLLLGLRDSFTFLHPAMALVQTALDPADPMAYMPRVAHAPLPGHPHRQVYQPVGKGDSYFPTTIQDAVALAYQNQEAGQTVWPTMQDALALEKLGGVLPYPVSQDRVSALGAAYTGVVVQYEGDGLYDPHAIYSQLDAVKYQYGCFFDTFVRTGAAVVPAPLALGTPCPTR